jgi:hypothetical protein
VIFWIGLVGALALTCAVAALRLIGHRQLGQFEVLASEPGRRDPDALPFFAGVDRRAQS